MRYSCLIAVLFHLKMIWSEEAFIRYVIFLISMANFKNELNKQSDVCNYFKHKLYSFSVKNDSESNNQLSVRKYI